MRIGVKSTLFRKIAAINTKYKITAAVFVLALGGMGLFALINRTSASTPNNATVTITSGTAYSYGSCAGMSGCPSSGKWETREYNVQSSAGTFTATCAEPNMSFPDSPGTAVILNNSSDATKISITRILLVTGNYNSSIKDAFNNANPSFWSNINTNTNGLSTTNPFVIGHIMIGKLYSGTYYFVEAYGNVFDSAVVTISNWFDANYPYAHLDWNLYSSNYDTSDYDQDVVWLESSPQNVYFNILKKETGTNTTLANAKFEFIRYNGTQKTVVSTNLTTGADGKLSNNDGKGVKITLGENATKWCFRETSAPSGYDSDSTTEYCRERSTLNENDQVVLNVYNNRTETPIIGGGFKLTKKKEINGVQSSFKGVKFRVEEEINGSWQQVYDVTTDSGGVIDVDPNGGIYDPSAAPEESDDPDDPTAAPEGSLSGMALPEGSYRIYEVCDSTVAAYDCSSTKYTFSITSSNAGQQQQINNGQPIVNTIKVPSYTTSAQKCAAAGDPVEKTIPISTNACVSDVINRGNNFVNGLWYSIEGKLMEVGSPTAIATVTKNWVQGGEGDDGSIYLTFENIDTTNREGKTLYVVTTLTMRENGNEVSFGTYNADGSDYYEQVSVGTIPRGGFTLTKQKEVNGSKSAFPGVKFNLTAQGSSTVLGTYTTGSDGTITTGNDILEAGSYTLTEVCDSTVAAYNCSSTGYSFTIATDGQIANVNNGNPIVNTLKVPSITTEARDCNSTTSTPSKQIPISSSACVADAITLTNFVAGIEYKITGSLKVSGSNTVLKTAETQAWTHAVGTTSKELQFSGIDTGSYANATLYVSAVVYMKDGGNWVQLAEFNTNGGDSNEEVTVSGYGINTTAAGASGSVDGQGRILAGDVTVNDTVTVTGLTQGTSYKIQGYVTDGSGNRITLTNGDAGNATYRTVDYTMSGSTGSEVSTTMDLQFDASPYTGQTLTVYEKVLDSTGNTTIVAHNGGSTQQVTVVNPAIATDAENAEVANSKTVSLGNVDVIDFVQYSGLVPHKTYTLKAKIYKSTDLEHPLTLINPDDAIVTFSPEESSGRTTASQSPVLSFSTTQMEPGSVLVVYEELYYGSTKIAEHKSSNDSRQQVTISPIQIGTSAASKANRNVKEFNVGKTAVIEDIVSLTGLVKGTSYKVKGWMVDQNNAEVTLLNGDNGGNTITKNITMTENTGTEVRISIDFEVDTVQYMGKSITVFEQLLDTSDHVIASYEVLADVNQTITIKTPSIGTTAVRKGTNSHELGVGDMVIQDTIHYENLESGESYTLVGKVMKVADNGSVSVLKINGADVTSTKTVTATGATGDWTMDFAISTVDIQGANLVVYEYLNHGNTEIAKHEDARVTTDNSQYIKVKVATIGTLAKDGLESGAAQDDVIEPEAGQKIEDTVSYSGLEPNATYTLTGKVMRKDNGQELKIDGHSVTGRTEFTSSSTGQGTTKVTFTLDATELPGVELVVFEKLFIGTDTTKPEIAKHEDIEDQNQFIKVRPRIGTIAADAYDSDQMVGVGNVKIVDKVRYEGLSMSKSYIMIGTLMDKETGEPVSSVARCKEEADDEDEQGDGGESEGEGSSEESEDEDKELCLNIQQKVQGRAEFTVGDEGTPETDGIVEMTFSLNTRDLAGRELVVFEEVYEADGYQEGTSEPVTEHKDLEDESQTVGVYVPEIKTVATDKSDDDKELNYSGIVTMTDKVQYSGLVAGTEYILRGKVMNKETGQPITLADGTIEVETIVTAKGESGYFTMDFEFRTDSIAGKDLVVFEYLYIESIEIDAETNEALIGEKEVARHEDLGDLEQTVHVKELPPDTGRMTQEGGSAVVVSVLSFVGVVTVGFTIASKRFWHHGGRHRLFEANQYGKSNWKRW